MQSQALFSKAVLAVVKQGRKSFDSKNKMCVYRGPDNLKCAVGHLISDEFYTEELEGLTPNEKPVHDALVASNPNQNIIPSQLRALQQAHDDADPDPENFTKDFIERASQVATTFNLEMPNVT